MMKIAFVQLYANEVISIHYLAGSFKEHGHQCDIFIEALEDNFVETVKDYNPDYLCVSLFIGEVKDSLEMLKRLRMSIGNAKVIAGGPAALICPDLYKMEEIDYLFRGDGEYTLPEFIMRQQSGQDLSCIAGLSYIDHNGESHVNNELLLNATDALPAPDRDLYYKYGILRNNSTKMFIGSRGCPYRCTYCYNGELDNFFSTSYWRLRSISQLIDEVKYVRDVYGLKWAYFIDGTFNANKKWLFGFLEHYRKENLPPFLCLCRVDNFDEETAKKLHEAGCERITFGIQSGNFRIRKDISGRNVSDDKIKEACLLCKKYSLRVVVDIIFGWPGETFSDAMDTIKLCREINVEKCFSNVLRFYPGTKISDYAYQNGYIDHIPDLQEIEFQSSNESSLVRKDRNIFINLDKLAYFLIKYPKLEKLFVAFLYLPPNRLFKLMKNLHVLQSNLKYNTEKSWLRLVAEYIRSNW